MLGFYLRDESIEADPFVGFVEVWCPKVNNRDY